MGRKQTEETRKKISEAHKGKIPWNKGKKFSEESKKKMSKVQKGRKRKPHSEETKKKMSESHIGIKPTTETCKKISEAKKGKPSWNKGKRMPEKFRKSIIGEGNSNWRGGKTGLAKRIRGLFNYRQWRSDIFTRDDFTCQECGVRGGELNADHCPKQFAEILIENNINSIDDAISCSELWNLNNGRTLCRGCHEETDTYGCKPIRQ